MVEGITIHVYTLLYAIHFGDLLEAFRLLYALAKEYRESPRDFQTVIDELMLIANFYHINPNAPVGAARNLKE